MEQGVLLLIYLTAASSIIVVAEDEEDGFKKSGLGCCRTRNIALGE